MGKGGGGGGGEWGSGCLGLFNFLCRSLIFPRGAVSVSRCVCSYYHDLQVGTSNTDVDNGSKLLSSETLPLSAADLLGELLHML